MYNFFDTNIFIAYATDFDNYHTNSIKLIENAPNKKTGLRVIAELEKLRRRRQKLLVGLAEYIRHNKHPQEYPFPSDIGSNDSRFLIDLFSTVPAGDINSEYNYIRQKTSEIWRRIDEAKRHVPDKIDYDNYPQFYNDIHFIQNNSDRLILTDAYCWVRANRSKIFFCTLDHTDYLVHTPRIHNLICQYSLCTLATLPIELRSVHVRVQELGL
jgi:hypothetical protein